MSLWSRWLSRFGSRAARRRPAKRYAPRFEPLEDRCVPAVSLIDTPGGTITLGTGTPLTDSATLSGGVNPTGYILFQLNDPNGNVVNEQIVAVNGNGTYNAPSGFIPSGTGTVVGTYQWSANYSGDAGNGAVQSSAAPEDVSAANPTGFETAGGAVVLGSGARLTDSVTLANTFNATGTLTFTLTAPDGTAVVDTETVNIAGNGTYQTPTGYLPGSTGAFSWSVSYSGDSNNNPLSSSGPLIENVNPAATTITATAGGTVLPGSGAALTASATLSGGVDPSGAILFTLTAPDGTIVDSEIVTVTGNGTYTTSTGYVPGLVGTYQWQASYSGDGSNRGASSTLGAAPEDVKISPNLTTIPSAAVVLGSGTIPNLTDSATLTGGISPTGTLTFSLVAPNGATSDTETVQVTGDGSYTTPTGLALPALPALPALVAVTGTYQWNVSYSGDGSNSAVSDRNDAAERITVSPATPTMTLTASANVTLGTTAPALTVAAVLAGGFHPTGSITFTVTGPNNLTNTQTVPVTGNGAYTAGVVLPTSAAVTGSYTWSASYTGDANDNAVSVTGTAANGGQTIVSPAGPALTTTLSAASVTLSNAAVVLGDAAMLSGGYSPTGTITFTLIAPGGSTVDTETINVSGNGTYATPTGYTLPTSGTVIGTYQWNASYSGDANNSTTGDTGAANERVMVSVASPTITGTPSAATVTPSVSTAPLRDSAVLTGGYAPTGTITFTLIGPDGTTLDTETVTAVGNGTYTTPNGYTLPTTGNVLGTYQWNVTYSGDANNNPAADINASHEQVVVGVAAPSLAVTAGPTVTVGAGTNLTASATLSGGVVPTGYILFTLTAPGGSVVDREIVPVAGNGTYTTPTGFLPKAKGDYVWSASYSGDSANQSVSNTANAETVLAATSPLLFTAPGGTITVGSIGKLSAAVILVNGSSPTGTVTFYLFAPGVTPNATDSNNVYSDTVTVKGNATYSTAAGNNPGGYHPSGTGTLTGKYQWVVTYTGDAFNNAATAATATETVRAASPKLTAKAGAAVTVGSGARLTDAVTLSGGANPGGVVLFTLTAPGGTIVDTEIVPVAGNATYQTLTGFVPTAPGLYTWTARYAGDGNNNTASASATESVLAAAPTLILASNPFANTPAGATITGSVTLAGGDHPTGTITFYLFAPGTRPNTSGSGSVYHVTVAVNGDGTYKTPTGYKTTKSGTYQWVARYSGDPNNTAVTAL